MSQSLDILCLGELASDKLVFFEKYTNSVRDEAHYNIFIKRFEDKILFFHDFKIDTALQVYMKYSYSGILFFSHIKHYTNTANTIISWLNIYSAQFGINIYKIPIMILVFVSKEFSDELLQKEKIKFLRQVDSIVSEKQVAFYFNNNQNFDFLNPFYKNIYLQINFGIKNTNRSKIAINGISQLFLDSESKMNLFIFIHHLMDYIRLKIRRKWKK